MIDAHVHLFPDEMVWRFYAWIEKKHELKVIIPIKWEKALEILKNMGIKQVFNLTHAITPEYSKMLNKSPQQNLIADHSPTHSPSINIQTI